LLSAAEFADGAGDCLGQFAGVGSLPVNQRAGKPGRVLLVNPPVVEMKRNNRHLGFALAKPNAPLHSSSRPESVHVNIPTGELVLEDVPNHTFYLRIASVHLGAPL
jgi:hypothetical protein